MLVKNCLGANGNDFWASTTYRYSLPKGRARKLVFFTPCMDAALCSLWCSYWRGLTVHGIYSISCGKETIDIFIKGGLFTGQAINEDLILCTEWHTYNINRVIISRITPNTALLQLLFGLSFWDISPPHLPQHRQQQKHKPTIGINRQNKIPIATTIIIPKA